MNWSEGSLGRVFVIRLEEGEEFNSSLETFAAERGVKRGVVFLLGGAGTGSRVVVGPATSDQGEGTNSELITADATPGSSYTSETKTPIHPLVHALAAPHEVLAIGTLFPDPQGRPVLHMHAAAGREGRATVGCTRAGTITWLVAEAILLEILGTTGERRVDPATGFELLNAR